MLQQYEEIAQELTNRQLEGRLLDVGTGPGRLLQAIHRLNPRLELTGLDISAAMIKQAQKNLSGMQVNLTLGNIRQTSFPDGYFDMVTCTGSFYLWDQPEKGLQEIQRILKPGKTAFLFECYRDCDRQAFSQALKENLRHLDVVSRFFGPLALKQALEAAYKKNEIRDMIHRSGFADRFSMQEITLSQLPIWLRIELNN